MTKLTQEQQAIVEANSGSAVPMHSADGTSVYYLVDENLLRHMQGLSKQQDEISHERLAVLIQEGIDSADVPAEEAHERIRAMAKQAADKYA